MCARSYQHKQHEKKKKYRAHRQQHKQASRLHVRVYVIHVLPLHNSPSHTHTYTHLYIYVYIDTQTHMHIQFIRSWLSPLVDSLSIRSSHGSPCSIRTLNTDIGNTKSTSVRPSSRVSSRIKKKVLFVISNSVIHCFSSFIDDPKRLFP